VDEGIGQLEESDSADAEFYKQDENLADLYTGV
jgi:hypothetical protein